MPSLPFAVIPAPLGTVASGNERTTNPASHLGEFDAIGMTWRSNGSGNLWARGDLGASSPVIDFASVVAANAVAGTLWRIRLGASQTAVDGTPSISDLAALANQSMTLLDTTTREHRAQKSGGAAEGWDSFGSSFASYPGDFVARIRPKQANSNLIVGLLPSSSLTAITNFSHNIILRSSGIAEAGASTALHDVALGAYATDSYWFLERVGTDLYIRKGGTGSVETSTVAHRFTGVTGTANLGVAIGSMGARVDLIYKEDFYDSVYQTFISPSIERPDGLYTSHFELPFARGHRWWRLDVIGHTGDFEAAALVLGKRLTPANYYSPGWTRGIEDLGSFDMTRWGIADAEPGLIFRTLDFRLGWQTEADFETLFQPLMQKLGKRGVALWCFDPTSSVYRQSKTYLGWMRGALAATHSTQTPAGIRYEQEFDILSMI